MPWTLREGQAHLRFLTSARMPWLIYQASEVTGAKSNSEYMRNAICEALARDLGLDADELKAECPSFDRNSGAVRRKGRLYEEVE